MAVRIYGPDTDLVYVYTVTLTLRYDPGQGLDTSLCHGQQLCEIVSISSVAVKSYGPDTDFGYVYTMTLTLEI